VLAIKGEDESLVEEAAADAILSTSMIQNWFEMSRNQDSWEMGLEV